MKKNIAILTYSNTTNYGAILQAYALKKYLQDNGYNSEVINYECEAVKKRENVFFDGCSISIKSLIKKIILIPIKFYRKINIYLFCKKNHIYSYKKYDNKTITELNDSFDIFIVGSDQIWNLKLNGHDDNYMLNFVNKANKKIAYAASIGDNRLINDNKKYYLSMLEEFDGISVREISTCDLLNKLGVASECVLDPTFLIDKKEWLQVINKNHRKRKYILLYFIHNGEKTFEIAKNMAKRLGFDLIYINNYGLPVKGMKNIYSITPFKFIEYIKNAELIITGSFHGIALSINLNKQFLYEENSSTNNVNDRIYSLSTIFKLNNSLNNSKLVEGDYHKWVDYDLVNRILREKKEESEFFLKKWVENNEERKV